MNLVIDVGNTNTCFAMYDNDILVNSFRLKTYLTKSYDEYYILVSHFIVSKIDDVTICSVVPIMTSLLNKLFIKYYKIKPLILTNTSNLGIKIIADDPKSVGMDLIADVVGGSKYFNEALIIDLGTASKYIYYKNNVFMGVSIAPGVSSSMKTLTENTALLPNFEIDIPKKIINNATIPCMQSGVIYGYACMVDGMIQRIKKEVENMNLKVILTGGLSKIIGSQCLENIDLIDDMITLDGIQELYKLNRKD